MKNLKYILLGAFSFLIINLILTGYGNIDAHREINQIIISKFQDKFIRTAFPLEKFSNYTFVFYGSHHYSGDFINSGGLLKYDIEEIEKKLNPGQWIVHGGYSADEPEIFASFRHFYDPTESAGNRYLHNHLDKLGEVNPKIDQIEWAINHYEHQYNWVNGKAAIVSALSTVDQDFKDKEMAFAYRALGEAFHMIADMGCPAHVRDDAHAAEPYSGWKLGSPDPFEEFMEDIAREEGLLKLFKSGKLDLDLNDEFRRAKTLEEIAIKLAKYSNSNFFTTQTISGSDVTPIIHPEKTYASPKLDDCTYDPVEYTYSKNISGNEVIMCRDLKYRFGIFENRGYPYIDKRSTYSQGKALLPQIVDAGTNVMRLFIPELEVQITDWDSDNRVLTGKVVHKTDQEYTREIKYNGKVAIYNAKNRNKLFEIECDDGKFEEKVKLLTFAGVNWKKNGIIAEIDFGGIFVRSEPFKEEIDFDVNFVEIDISINGDMHSVRDLGLVVYDETYAGYHMVLRYQDLALTSLSGGLRANLEDLSDGNEVRTGYIIIDMRGTEIRSIKIVDEMSISENGSSTVRRINMQSIDTPFKNGFYNYRDEDDGIHKTHSYSISNVDFFSSFDYYFKNISPSAGTDWVTTQTITSLLPERTAIMIDLTYSKKYDESE